MAKQIGLIIPEDLIDALGGTPESVEQRLMLTMGADLHLVGNLALEDAAASVGAPLEALAAFVDEKLHREIHVRWVVGNFRAQNEFGETRTELLSAVARLRKLAQEVTDRIRHGGPLERFLFIQYLMIGEDLNEILILCANDSTTGAMKTLRGMFERTVVLRRLVQHPEQLDDFVDYHPVRMRKLAREINRLFPGKLTNEELVEIERNYQDVLPRFQARSPRRGTSSREPMSWTRESIVKLAKDVGCLSTLILPAYYVPMGEVHSTEAAVFRRAEISETGSFEFRDRPGFEEQDSVLASAHYLLILATETALDHFKWEDLKNPLSDVCKDFHEVWTEKNQDEVAKGEPK